MEVNIKNSAFWATLNISNHLFNLGALMLSDFENVFEDSNFQVVFLKCVINFSLDIQFSRVINGVALLYS